MPLWCTKHTKPINIKKLKNDNKLNDTVNVHCDMFKQLKYIHCEENKLASTVPTSILI